VKVKSELARSWSLSAAAAGAALAMATMGTGCDDPEEDGSTVEGEFEHLYAAVSITWADEDNIGYLNLLPDLDRKKVDLDDAIEMPGWPGVYQRDGKLFVSDGEEPTLTRYRVDGKGNFIKEKSISFMRYGADFASVDFVADDKGYAFTDEGIVWDPREMKVTGTFEPPDVKDREGGLEWSHLGVGRAFAVQGDRAYVATHWANWDTYEMAEDSLIVVIDTEKDEVIKTIEAPCPYLDVATVDDDGYVYFSNWTYSVSQTLLQDKAQACAVRIAPGEDELDEDWKLTFADVTGGHEGGVLRYAGDGKAVFAAYREDRIEGGVEDYVEEAPGELADMSNWEIWMVDLETKKAEPVKGLGPTSGGYYMSRVDTGTFILAPDDEYTETTFYQVSSNGEAEARFTVEGWVLDVVQVR
jgi:hypothetical protein